MKIVTNGIFAIPLIPECRQYSIETWAKQNQLTVADTFDGQYDYYIPYRNSYDRIIRGLAADFHELMLNDGTANLNKKSWAEVETIAREYILRWASSSNTIPIQKQFCHSGFYKSYLAPRLERTIFFDVADLSNLPTVLNEKYNLSLTLEIPDLPEGFYEHTVPYWVIDEYYKINKQLADKINLFCTQDTEKNINFEIVKL